uniref:DUF4351 domain-containing protein n=1 Tax=Cyanothece sp. (strain PCC 7425 / ATCC 29141) TaxID=395961 RepID=B8HK69_CYAP4
MTRIPFDQLAKQYLETLLEPLGTVQRNLEVPGEVRYVDLWFTPSTRSADLPDLGMLSQITTTPCLLEPFSSPPSRSEVRTCLLKLLWLMEDRRRRAKVSEQRLSENELPRLWILAASLSQPVIDDFGGQVHADSGVYLLPTAYRTGMIAINQLPITEETLWLRLIGRGETQRAAVMEVLALPMDDPRRAEVLQVLTNWRLTLEMGDVLETEEEELMATLSQAYLEWEQKTREQGLQQGLQEGLEQGKKSLILSLLTRRFGELPEGLRLQIDRLNLSQLDSLGETLLDFSSLTDLQTWLETTLK